MQLPVPEYIRSLVPYVPGKPIEETQREYKLRRVIKLASNENPLGPSPKGMRAVRLAVNDLHRYPDAAAYRLKARLAQELGVDSNTISVGNGSNEIIDLLIRAFCLVGDSIATSKGAFIAYKICAQIQGVTTLESELTSDLRFDLLALNQLVKQNSRCKIVFIANPNNPTGTYVSSSELVGFLKSIALIRNGNLLVVLDYAYWEYVTAKDLPDAIELLSEFKNVVVLRTFSKIYGLAGLRVGYGVSSPEITAMLEKVRQPFNLNALALTAAEAALSDSVFCRKSLKANELGMRFWEKTLAGFKIPYWKSQGNFLLADVEKGLGKTGMEIYQSCLRKGVIFRPVANYGFPNALRISMGTAEENRIAAKALAQELPPGFDGKSR